MISTANRPPRRHRVPRVDREVEQGILKQRTVDDGQVRGSPDQDPKLDRLAKRAPQEFGEIGHERADVGRLRVERLAPAEGEELGGELRAILRGVVSLARELALVGIGEHGVQQFQIGDDHGQDDC